MFVDSGILYSWGRADLGQLGRTCMESCDHIPGVVAKLAGVRSHSCGSEHSLAVTGRHTGNMLVLI